MIEIQNEHDDEIKKKIWNETNENKEPGFFIKYGGYFFSVIYIICFHFFTDQYSTLGGYEWGISVDILIDLIPNIIRGLFIGGILSILNSLFTSYNFQRNYVIGCIISCILSQDVM